MKRTFNLFATLFIISQLAALPTFAQVFVSDNIRPIQDSIGFCWDAEEMDHFIEFLSKNNPDINEDSRKLVAAISFHDDYLYAGNVYYPLHKNIRTKEVVIFGVAHGTVKKEMGTLSIF